MTTLLGNVPRTFIATINFGWTEEDWGIDSGSGTSYNLQYVLDYGGDDTTGQDFAIRISNGKNSTYGRHVTYDADENIQFGAIVLRIGPKGTSGSEYWTNNLHVSRGVDTEIGVSYDGNLSLIHI